MTRTRSRKVTTLPGTSYSPSDQAALRTWLEQIKAADLEDADRITIDADVEFAGTFNPSRARTFRADGLDLKGVAEALRSGKGPDRLATYTKTGWRDQLGQLQGTKAGREALAQALNISDRTRRRWSAGGNPSKANRTAIAQAYEVRATDPRALAPARARAERARDAQVADAFNAALTERYGADVRFFNITNADL